MNRNMTCLNGSYIGVLFCSKMSVVSNLVLLSTYSPNMTIIAVEINIAQNPPPPVRESSTIGRVSFTMTFENNSVTKTQYLPLLSNESTWSAWFFSDSDPVSTNTWRLVSSSPIRPKVKPNNHSLCNQYYWKQEPFCLRTCKESSG